MHEADRQAGNDRKLWTEDELVLALLLYLRLPHGKQTSRNQDVLALAGALGRTPSSVARKLGNLAACDPEYLSNGRRGLVNGSRLDKLVWNRYVGSRRTPQALDQLLSDAEGVLASRTLPLSAAFGGVSKHILSDGETEVPRRTIQRLHQDYFRQMVLANFSGACAVTHLASSGLVEAAHIASWSESPEHRLDPCNGIALNALLHKAYDLDLLGISPDRKVVVAPQLLRSCRSGKAVMDFFLAVDGANFGDGVNFSLNPEFLDQRFQRFNENSKQPRDVLGLCIPSSAGA